MKQFSHTNKLMQMTTPMLGYWEVFVPHRVSITARAEAVKSWWESPRTPGGLELLFNLLTCWEQLFHSFSPPPPSLHRLSDVKRTGCIQTRSLRGEECLALPPWLNLSVQYICGHLMEVVREVESEDNWEGNSGVVSSVAAGQVQRSMLRRLYRLIS